MMFPAFAAISLYSNRRGSAWATLVAVFSPTAIWGPAEEHHFIAWKQFKEQALSQRKKLAIKGKHSWLRQKLYILIGKYR